MPKISPNLLASLKGEKPLPPWMYLLYPASVIYGMGGSLKAWAYTSGLIKPKRLPCKVISVGNITAGGTGKTPLVIHIARMLTEKGIKTAVVTRGYKGKAEGKVQVVSDGMNILPAAEAGDEPVLIARSLPGVPVVMGSDRYAAGTLAWERFRPQAVLLDDGFQHLRLHRDLNILLMDSAHPFGNGYTVPMGYLREPKNGIKRADLAIFTGGKNDTGFQAEKVKKYLKPGISMLNATYKPISICNLKTHEITPVDALSGQAVFSFCGIANPGSFSLILHKLNAKITGSEMYPDHHSYSAKDVGFLREKAAASGAQVIVTTEKDAVKLEGLIPADMEIYALKAGLEINDARLLEAALDKVFAAG